MACNHCKALDRLRARVYSSNQIRKLNRLRPQPTEVPEMDAMFALFIAISAFAGLGVAALGWGVDSRPGMADDHAR